MDRYRANFETGLSDWEWRSKTRQFLSTLRGKRMGLETCAADVTYNQTVRDHCSRVAREFLELESELLKLLPQSEYDPLKRKEVKES